MYGGVAAFGTRLLERAWTSVYQDFMKCLAHYTQICQSALRCIHSAPQRVDLPKADLPGTVMLGNAKCQQFLIPQTQDELIIYL